VVELWLLFSAEMLRILHGAMLLHKADVDVQVNAMELFRVIVMLTTADVLSGWATDIVSATVESMEEFSNNDIIESTGLNIFATPLQKTLDFDSYQDCFRFIVRGLQSDNEVTVLQSSWLLAKLLTNDTSAGDLVLDYTSAVSGIIECMVKHDASSEVQLQCCLCFLVAVVVVLFFLVAVVVVVALVVVLLQCCSCCRRHHWIIKG